MIDTTALHTMPTLDRPIKIGTRGSRLALWQAHWVRDRITKYHPNQAVDIITVKTKGDKILDAALSKIGDKGLFTREIEHKLLCGEIDLAVHSLKDLPTALPEGLTLAAISPRQYPADVLVSKNHLALEQLPSGATVLTGSLRRKAQLLHSRPDLTVEDVRGNIQTRLRKLDQSDAVAIILAQAGLIRLDLADRISQVLPPESFIPAVSQGALGIEIRADDRPLQTLLEPLHDPDTAACCQAERALLHRLEGGCQIPIGAYARIHAGQLRLTAMIASLDGTRRYLTRVSGCADRPLETGQQAAEDLIQQGGQEILRQIRYNQP